MLFDESIEIAGGRTYLSLIWLHIRYAKKHTANVRRNEHLSWTLCPRNQLACVSQFGSYINKKVIILNRFFQAFSLVNSCRTLWSIWRTALNYVGLESEFSCSRIMWTSAVLDIIIRKVSIAVQTFQSKTVGERPFSLGHFHPSGSSFNVSAQRIESTKTLWAFCYIISEIRKKGINSKAFMFNKCTLFRYLLFRYDSSLRN